MQVLALMLAANVIKEVAKMTNWILGLGAPARYALLTVGGLAVWLGVCGVLVLATRAGRLVAWRPAARWGDAVEWRRRAFRRARHRTPWW